MSAPLLTRLPLQGGVETTAWIRCEEARRRAAGVALRAPPTPIVGLTGSVHPDDVAACLSGARVRRDLM